MARYSKTKRTGFVQNHFFSFEVIAPNYEKISGISFERIRLSRFARIVSFKKAKTSYLS